MKNILICSIIRNQAENLDLWHGQLTELVNKLDGYNVYLSVFENDSEDGTQELLYSYDYSIFLEKIIKCQVLGLRQYGSTHEEERLKNLAFYRQSCIDNFRNKFPDIKLDKVAFIESDIEYNSDWCKELILARHFQAFGWEPDIYSGWSLRNLKNPKESMFLYDTAATRRTDSENCYNFNDEHKFLGESVIRTGFSHVDSNCVHKFWSTFNCFCVYNALPFYEDVKWSCINKRFDNGQKRLNNGWLEVDTVAICEDFREKGYDRIFVNRNCLVRHLT